MSHGVPFTYTLKPNVQRPRGVRTFHKGTGEGELKLCQKVSFVSSFISLVFWLREPQLQERVPSDEPNLGDPVNENFDQQSSPNYKDQVIFVFIVQFITWIAFPGLGWR